MALLDTNPFRLAIKLICLGPARERCLPLLEITRRVLVNSRAKSKCEVHDVTHISFRDNEYDSQQENGILRAFSALINAVYMSTALGEHESSDLTVHAEI